MTDEIEKLRAEVERLNFSRGGIIVRMAEAEQEAERLKAAQELIRKDSVKAQMALLTRAEAAEQENEKLRAEVEHWEKVALDASDAIEAAEQREARLLSLLNTIVGTTLAAFPALAHQPIFIEACAALAEQEPKP